MTSTLIDNGINVVHLFQKKIPVAPLTLRLLQTYYSSEDTFHINNKDIYYRRIIAQAPYRPADPSDLLRCTASFTMTKSIHTKVKSEVFSLGFYLYKESQHDMCTYLMAQHEAGRTIKDAIEHFYFKHGITEADYKREACDKLFYRYRKRLAEIKKQKNTSDYHQNKKANQTKHVIQLDDKQTVHPKQILSLTAQTFDVTIEQILSPTKMARITDARHTAIYLMLEAGMTQRQTAQHFKISFKNFSRIRQKIEFDIKFENVTGLRAKSLLNSLFYDRL